MSLLNAQQVTLAVFIRVHRSLYRRKPRERCLRFLENSSMLGFIWLRGFFLPVWQLAVEPASSISANMKNRCTTQDWIITINVGQKFSVGLQTVHYKALLWLFICAAADRCCQLVSAERGRDSLGSLCGVYDEPGCSTLFLPLQQVWTLLQSTQTDLCLASKVRWQGRYTSQNHI